MAVTCSLFGGGEKYVGRNVWHVVWSNAVLLTDIFFCGRTCGHRRIAVAALYKPY
jgi:hypothetical protein